MLAPLEMLYIITALKEAAMTPRFICPHCHSPIDPQTMDLAVSASEQYRVCPECDEPTAVFANSAKGEKNAPSPSLTARCTVLVAESRIL
jgi:hypothetical protein